MAPINNETVLSTTSYSKPTCLFTIYYPSDSEPGIHPIFRIFKCFIRRYPWSSPEEDEININGVSGSTLPNIISPEGFIRTTSFPTTTISSSSQHESGGNDENLQFITFKIILPIVLILIAICFVLGVILIVKTHMMAPLKQNLAVAIRRRRRVGHAPDNNYVPQEEIRASQRWSTSSDRKSFPPPEVLLAARERASQMITV